VHSVESFDCLHLVGIGAQVGPPFNGQFRGTPLLCTTIVYSYSRMYFLVYCFPLMLCAWGIMSGVERFWAWAGGSM